MRSDWRLLIVVNVPWFFVMHRLPIASMARERGVDVHIACGEGEGAEDITAQGFPFHRLPLTRRTLAPLRDAQTVAALVKLYRRLQPDIVHHVTLKPVIYGSMAARIAKVPAVVNAFAGLGYTFIGDSAAARLRRWTIQKLLTGALRLPRQAVVFENKDDLLLLTRAGVIPADRARVIAGVGVDTNIYTEAEESRGPVRVVFASRMLREKGVEYFVQAARQLRSKGIRAQFALVGMPDSFNPGSISEKQLRAWHEEGVVTWEGFRRDMPRVLQEAHVVCLPTYYREGVPRILLEAAACGRPIVTTDMAGCRDIVEHEVNGLIVAPHDVSGLATALERLIADRALRSRFGIASRDLVERRFALPRVLDEFWQLYSSLLAAPRNA